MELSKSVTLLACLAQESRLTIFRHLVQAGPSGMTPSVLQESLAMPAATLSFHLKELYQAGLANRVRHGRSIVYSANFECMSALVSFLQQNCCADSSCNSC